MRADLVVQRQRWQGREYWTIKDPLTLRYYRFEDEEFAILEMLDGQASSEEICERFETAIRPAADRRRRSCSTCWQCCTAATCSLSDAPGQGEQLSTRAGQRQPQEAAGTLANFLAIRFRGVDPDRLLTWLDRRIGWLFSLPAAAAVALARCCPRCCSSRRSSTRSARGCRVSGLLRRPELAVAGVPSWRHQGPARVRPRPGLQAVRRRVPRDGRDAAGLHALPVLQRQRRLDDPQPLAAGGDRRGGHVRRADPRVAGHVRLVVQRAGTGATTWPST